MNRKQFTLLIALGLVLGGLGLYLNHRQKATFGQSGQALGGKLLPDFPMNDVALIRIHDDTTELQLAKDDGIWRVRQRHNYPADYGTVSSLLRKVWELKAVQSEEVGPSQWPRLQMADPGHGTNSGVRLEFKDAAGKELGTLVLGKKHLRQSASPSPFGGDGWPDGRYLRVAGGTRVALVSDAFSEVESKPDRFLNKDFIKVEKLRSVRVTPTDATNAWALRRDTEGGPWQLLDLAEGESLDTTKTSSLNWLLSNPMFDDVVDPATGPDVTGFDAPVVAELETFDGFRYTVKIGNKTDDDKYYVSLKVAGAFDRERLPTPDEKEEDKERLDREFKEKLAKLDDKLTREQAFAPWTYLVSKWTVDNLLKTRPDFLQSKTESTATTSDFDDHDHDHDHDHEHDADDGDPPIVPQLFE